MAGFSYQEDFIVGEDRTSYRLLTKDYVSTLSFGDNTILKVEKEALTLLTKEAISDVSFS